MEVHVLCRELLKILGQDGFQEVMERPAEELRFYPRLKFGILEAKSQEMCRRCSCTV